MEAMLHITSKTIREMTSEQYVALKENVVKEGLWDTVKGEVRIWMDWETVMVSIPGQITLGIEPDGYTHS